MGLDCFGEDSRGRRHSEDEKDHLTRANYSNWTSANLYFG